MSYLYIQENDIRMGTTSSKYSTYYTISSNHGSFYSELQNYHLNPEHHLKWNTLNTLTIIKIQILLRSLKPTFVMAFNHSSLFHISNMPSTQSFGFEVNYDTEPRRKVSKMLNSNL